MRGGRFRVLWLVLALALLGASVPLAHRLGGAQARLGPPAAAGGRAVRPPPELSLAAGLGVFRSVLVDVLWLRAAEMQRQGRFYELVQLYDLIGALQPYQGAVWAYAAWNMAYNVSVEIPSHQERWRWVNNGLDRLRHDGLRYNPGDRQVFWELGWIFSHKIGRNMDDAHLLYKTRLAEAVQEVFAGFEPEARALLAAAERGDPRALAARERLRQDWGMELADMADTEADPRLGPLDWRMAETHAIHWARLGLLRGDRGKRALDLERLVYQSMQHLLRQGRLFYFPAGDGQEARIALWPDYRQVWPMARMFEEQLARFTREDMATGVRSAYSYFLEEALEILWLAAQEEEAERLFVQANRSVPGIVSGTSARDHVARTMAGRLRDMGADQFSGLVSSLLLQHYWWTGQGDGRRAAFLLERARELWKLNLEVNPTAMRAVNRTLRDVQLSTLRAVLADGVFPGQIVRRLRATVPAADLSAAEANPGKL